MNDITITPVTSLSIGIEVITPAKAEKYLNVNKANRKLRAGIAEKYATDMRRGNWTTCAAPIIFYDDGDLADGQHRLFAVVESEIPQTFTVVRNFPREAGLNIDTGLVRSIVDNGRISGQDTALSHTMVATARAINTGLPNTHGISYASKLEAVETYREAVQFAMTYGPKGRGLRNSAVLGAIGRAWYREEDKDRLKRFGEVLGTGFVKGENDAAAIALRNYMLMKGQLASHSSLWRDTFLKAQNAIWHFMRERQITMIRSVSDEAYPLEGVGRSLSGGNRKVTPIVAKKRLIGAGKKAAIKSVASAV